MSRPLIPKLIAGLKPTVHREEPTNSAMRLTCRHAVAVNHAKLKTFRSSSCSIAVFLSAFIEKWLEIRQDEHQRDM
ncbi:hypothetical protein ACTXPX_03420 [Glutamicibacter arilaitensis]